jgi:hypothetical protein
VVAWERERENLPGAGVGELATDRVKNGVEEDIVRKADVNKVGMVILIN